MGTVPATYNLADAWEMAADAVPDREALVTRSHRLTYAELDARAAQEALDERTGAELLLRLRERIVDPRRGLENLLQPLPLLGGEVGPRPPERGR